MNQQLNYARTQADGLDNIAPTSLQGQQAWQYAQSDNFLSPEEASAVIRKQLEPYQAQIEAKLAQIGYDPDHLETLPDLRADLFSGRQTDLSKIFITPEIEMSGRLRIVPTEDGFDIRITPSQRQLTIPDEVGGIKLSKGEKDQLAQDGSILRPFMMPDKGDFVPTFLRVDERTNTVELWRVRPEQLPTRLLGIDLTKDQQLSLANGHAVRLSGLLDRQGEPFNATVAISATQKELQFTDFNRLDVKLKPDSEHRQQLAINNDGAKTDLTRSQELATGSTVTNNQQRALMQDMLDGKLEQKLSSPKQRLA